ncbi:MAG: helix-turn-helix transcriptional regulator [Bacteroidales bacterium]|nr:helix-turn-helix transcriptional regulator [Bacteroidales bacterium]
MIERIKSLMNHYELSAAQFADQIGVQRSALSHVLSGRNRPSLDFVIKIKSEFPEINLDWVTMGNGPMIGDEITSGTQYSSEDQEDRAIFSPQVEEHLKPGEDRVIHKNTQEKLHSADAKELKEIVLFYTDGTFERFVQK